MICFNKLRRHAPVNITGASNSLSDICTVYKIKCLYRILYRSKIYGGCINIRLLQQKQLDVCHVMAVRSYTIFHSYNQMLATKLLNTWTFNTYTKLHTSFDKEWQSAWVRYDEGYNETEGHWTKLPLIDKCYLWVTL